MIRDSVKSVLNDSLLIHLDWETYSEEDLTKVGAYRYAEHPSTDVLLGSYVIGRADRAKRWRPGDHYPFEKYHDRLGEDVFVVAWNSQFERLIWWQVMCDLYGWPKPPLEAFICAAAWARSTASSPGKLELAGQFFGQQFQKDMAGHRLMLQICKPATDAQQSKFLLRYHEDALHDWEHELIDIHGLKDATKRCHHTPEKLDRLHSYCDDDTLTEASICDILPVWRDAEITQFWANERINDRGVVVDDDFALAATTYADEEKAELRNQLIDITGDPGMTPRTFARFKKWALPRMSDDAIDICEFYDKGEKKITFDANARTKLLLACDYDDDFLSPEVHEAIEVLDLAGKSTVSKYDNICKRATGSYNDGRPRVHGLYMFAGAAQSGRLSSVGIQAHNLVRDVPGNAAEIIRDFKSGTDAQIRSHGSPIHVLGKLVRPTITGDPQDEFDLVWGDWAAFEARILPWLSLEKSAEDLLGRFWRDEDIYLKVASTILGRKITKADKFERQAYGKVPQLSLGFVGGVGALMAMARGYGVHFDPDDAANVVREWRKANPWAMAFANNLQEKAMLAIRRPGVGFSAGRITYVFEEDALDGLGALFAYLPSGRAICYPDPRIDAVKKPWGLTTCITARKGAWHPKKGEDDWPRVAVWRGLLAENATQATQADFLTHVLVEAEKPEWSIPIVAHTHDEIIAESRFPEEDAARLKRLMETKPKWIPGIDALPLKAEIEYGYRYKVPFAA